MSQLEITLEEEDVLDLIHGNEGVQEIFDPKDRYTYVSPKFEELFNNYMQTHFPKKQPNGKGYYKKELGERLASKLGLSATTRQNDLCEYSRGNIFGKYMLNLNTWKSPKEKLDETFDFIAALEKIRKEDVSKGELNPQFPSKEALAITNFLCEYTRTPKTYVQERFNLF